MSISNKPQEIDEHNWYYERRKGIEIVHEVMGENGYIQSDFIKIPWKMIRRSLRRKDHKKIRK